MSHHSTNPRNRRTIHTTCVCAALVGGSLLACSRAEAQDVAAEVEPAPAVALPAEEPQAKVPAIVLLREGSHLARVIGRLRSDAGSGSWILTIDPDAKRMPNYELTLLPCTYLEEMQQVITSAPEHELVFEITGQVFVYHDRNYVMPTHPPLLVGHAPVSDGDGAETPVTDENPEDPTPPDTSGGKTAADIIKELEASTRPPVRRPPAAVESSDADRTGTEEQKLRLEGTVLTDRRAKIRRTGAGTYVAIFDADAEGQSDPPMTLLPCLLLERLERHAREVGEQATVLISGHVFTYRDRNYLRSTIYRVPRERTQMTP